MESSPSTWNMGEMMVTQWLTQVLNCTLELETILQIFRHSIIVPVYKTKGIDPPLVWQLSWHITGINPGKGDELFMLNCIHTAHPTKAGNTPHQFQTAYRKMSCNDTIFANMESIMHLINQGDRIYMCACDLEKAFHMVEFSILIKNIFNADINGKAWRVIESWYHHPTACVRAIGLVLLWLVRVCVSGIGHLSHVVPSCDGTTVEGTPTLQLRAIH